MNSELDYVGKRVNKVDALSKALGSAKYVADLKRPDMLIGKALYAKYPHALIKSIDVSKAKALEGVEAVITAEDLPGRNAYGLRYHDKPVIANVKTRYEGDHVAFVAAINEGVAREALKLIEIEYEELPVYDDPREAMREDAVQIHAEHPFLEQGNRLETVVIDQGDMEKAFAEADIIIENEYETPIIDHAYMELDACIAEPDPLTGGITLINPQQAVSQVKRSLAPVFGIPQNKIRVISPLVGGGFGGKECAGLDVCVVAGILALKTKKTIFVELSREEVFRTTTKRHASFTRYRLAANSEGKITAVDVEMILDKGAYLSLGGGKAPRHGVVSRAAARSGGAYTIPNSRVRAFSVFTNHAYAGALRGFGAPQGNYVIECQMDELARRLNMDPIELRLKNVLRHGDKNIHGQEMIESRGLGLEECLEKVKKRISWDKPISKGSGPIKRGRGLAVLMYGTSNPNQSDGAGCYVTLEHDGTVSVSVALSELGQGLSTTLGQIAAETLGVKFEDVAVNMSDTGCSPEAGTTTASRSLTLAGNAVVDACQHLRNRMVNFAAISMEEEPENIVIRNGMVQVKNQPGKSEKLGTLVTRAFNKQIPLSAYGCWFPPQSNVRSENGLGDLHFAYSFGAHAIELEVDTETGAIAILRSVLACDVGKAINPEVVEGQMEGAVAQTIGWSLMEETLVNKGIMQNAAFHNYLIPTAMDIPDLESIIVEHHNELGPYGAKGIGEPPTLATAPAIRNALYDALGFAINVIPLTPRVVLGAIKDHESGQS